MRDVHQRGIYKFLINAILVSLSIGELTLH